MTVVLSHLVVPLFLFYFFTLDGSVVTLGNTNIISNYTFVTFDSTLFFFSTFDYSIVTFGSTNITYDRTFVTFGGTIIFFSHLIVPSSHWIVSILHLTILLSHSVVRSFFSHI